ncbi:MAG: amidohydrolase family protein [Ilumatobacteraceae bacterium]|nr:amidohydrolase family protein [Ilumatobacteraceae bacterium]
MRTAKPDQFIERSRKQHAGSHIRTISSDCLTSDEIRPKQHAPRSTRDARRSTLDAASLRRRIYRPVDDVVGVCTTDFIGACNLMWGSDYPHGNSIFPDSQQILDELFEGNDDDRRRITVENAIELYDLPFTSTAG